MAGLILLLGSRSALAQEVCYAYDGLRRLIAAMDPQGQAAIYKYDAVGNILAIDREAASGLVDIILMDPLGIRPGHK
jgi:YD repeat-containing protein